MSILTEKLPDYLVVRGKKCIIKTDFKTWLKFSETIGREGKIIDKITEILRLVFYEIPPNLEEAFVEMMKFYSREPESKRKGNSGASKAVYDFEFFTVIA